MYKETIHHHDQMFMMEFCIAEVKLSLNQSNNRWGFDMIHSIHQQTYIPITMVAEVKTTAWRHSCHELSKLIDKETSVITLMAYCKAAVTALLMHWGYCSFALSYRYPLLPMCYIHYHDTLDCVIVTSSAVTLLTNAYFSTSRTFQLSMG